MKKINSKKLLAFIVAFLFTFNFLFSISSAGTNTIEFSANDNELITNKYDSAIYGNAWERKYEIEIVNQETNDKVKMVIPTINHGIIEKEIIEQNIPSQYKLTKFIETINPDIEPGNMKPQFVDTIFDIGCFAMSVAEFAAEPTFWNGFNVVADGLSIAFPGIPAVSGVKRMIKASDDLADALRWGIARYDDLRDAKAGISRFSHLQSHHIVEQRFIEAFSEIPSTNSMFAINIPSYYHTNITNKMRELIPYGSDYIGLGRYRILDKIQQGYKELYDETGDEVYEFLHDFVNQSDQFHTTTHVDITVPDYFRANA